MYSPVVRGQPTQPVEWHFTLKSCMLVFNLVTPQVMKHILTSKLRLNVLKLKRG